MCNDEIKYHEKKIIINDNKKRREQKFKKKRERKTTNTNKQVRLIVRLISWYMYLFSPQYLMIFFLKLNTCLCICSSDTSYNGLIIYISENEKIEKINVDYDLINFKFIYCSEFPLFYSNTV